MPTSPVTRVMFDYDNMTLKEVVTDLMSLGHLWFDVTERVEIYQSSEGNHQAVLSTIPIEFKRALQILGESGCSAQYKEFVINRGFTRRVTAKKDKPAPKLVFSAKTGLHYKGGREV